MNTASYHISDDPWGAVVAANDDVLKEVANTMKWRPYNSMHEAYAVLAEEVDEFWDEVRKKARNRNTKDAYKELIQIAAIATAYAAQIKEEDDGRDSGTT